MEDYTQKTDEDLAKLIQKNRFDEQAWGEIFLRYHELIHRTVGRKFWKFDRDDWQDIAQDIQIAFLKAIPRFRAENGCSLKTYLTSIILKSCNKKFQMKCRKSEIHERLLFYLEGELRAESERTQIQRHLKECPMCRKEQRRYLKATHLLLSHQESSAHFELPPFHMTETLQAHIQGNWFNRLCNAIKTISRIVLRPAWGIPAIALLMLLVGGAYLISVSEPTPNEGFAVRAKSQATAGGYKMGSFQFGFGGLPLY